MSDPIPLTIATAKANHPRTIPANIRRVKVAEFLRSNRFSDNTRKAYDRELKRFLSWTDLHWLKLKSRHMALYKEYLLVKVGLAKPSVNLALAALKSFFSWMMITYPELLPTSPMVEVKFEKLRLPPAQNLKPEEMDRVWAAVEELDETQLRDTVLVHLLRHGLRAGEAAGLLIGLYDGQVLLLDKTKSRKPRLVPLLKAARDAIAAYWAEREAAGEELMSGSSMLLSYLPGRRGGSLSYSGVYQAIERLGRLSGVDNLHPHRLRHTYATEILLKGLDPHHAMKLTGHGDARSFQRYTLAAEQQAAVNEFYRIYGESE